ncbi:MAG: SRPBCC domain-containing protein [Pseudomonadota bacterium]
MTTTDTGSFTISRTMPVSPDQLWHLVTDPDMRDAWGAPGEGMVMVTDVKDFTVGGFETHRCGPAENPEFTVETRWYRIEAPHDAVFTETILVGGAAMATTLVTYRITPEGSGSALHVNVAVSSFDGPGGIADVEEGWTGGLANLEALAAQHAA